MIQQINKSDFIHLTLTGEPQSTNHIYRSHCRFGFPSVYMSAKGKALKEDYQWQIKSQYHGKPIKCEVFMEVSLFFGTKRKQDIDNFSKILNDSLTGLIFEDDSQIQSCLISKFVVKKKDARIEIKLLELNKKLI